LGAAKQVFKELSDVLEKVALGKTPARRGAQIALAAAERAKLQFSVRDFERAVSRFSKIDPGEDIVTFNVSRMQNWLRSVTDKTSKVFDKNFTDALKKELPAIKDRLRELNKLIGTGSAAGPGSIVVRGIGANSGRALATMVFGLAGFGAAGPLGAGAGALLGASMPEMMVAILTSKSGFKALQTTLASGSGEMAAKTWFAIGELITRGSAFDASRKERDVQPPGDQEQAIFPESEDPTKPIPGLLELLGIETPEGKADLETLPGAGTEIEGGEGDEDVDGGTGQIKAKEGVDLTTLQPEAQSATETAQTVLAEFGVEAIVTSTGEEAEGRLTNSKHFEGQAFDLRISSIPKSKLKEVVASLAASLGGDYDVVLKKDHIHVEFDPKKPQ
ncbi:hypothetical protein LCGC14_2172400, partial [marine sediment metagenome]